MEQEAELSVVDILTYYATPSPMTDLGEHADLLVGLPTEVRALRDVVQGLLIHIFWTDSYGVTPSERRKKEIEIRSVADMLAHIHELDARPLADRREAAVRLVANSRGYSLLLTAFLRHRDMPARARCGFGAYLKPDRYEDHWICEYWDADDGRWVAVDAQLDELQCRTLQIRFDPLDVPADQFVTAGRAWLTCRAGEADPESFGAFDLRGLSFVRGNIGRDVWSLNKLEALPWDGWGLPWKAEEDVTDKDRELLDRVARLIVAGNDALPELRSIYQSDPAFRIPAGWPGR